MVVVRGTWEETGSRKPHEEVTAREDDILTWGSGGGGKEGKKDLKAKRPAKTQF